MVAFKSCFLLLVDDVHGLCREPRATHGSFDGNIEYFTICNCVFNFNILALVVSEILGGFKFMIGATYPPVRPLVENFCTRGEYFTMSNGVFNFNFLALVFSEIFGGSQIYTRGPYAPWTPP